MRKINLSRRDPMSLGGVYDEEFANKMGVAYSIGCGPRPSKGFVYRLQLCLNSAEANVSNIKKAE